MIFLIPEMMILAASGFMICQSAWTGQFSFEYSFFLSLMIFAAVTISALLRKNQTSTLKARLRLIYSYLATLLAPLAIVLIYATKYGLCSLKSGVIWFLLIPVITLIYSLACAVWAKNSKRSGWKLWLTCLMPTILLSILTLRDLYVDPQISFYHPVLGYFPGPVYDEWIPRFFSLYSYRGWTLLFSTWFLIEGLVPWKYWKIGFILFIPLLFRDTLGWHHSHRYVQKYLGSHIETAFADIYFPQEMLLISNQFAKQIDVDIYDITKRLEIEQPTQKIKIYIYPAAYTKKRLTGTQFTLIGNPMQRSLHLLSMNANDPVLVHELTHVVASPLGIPLLHISPKLGLLEGLATAVEQKALGLTIHQWSKIMLMNGELPDLEKTLDFVSFWKQNPTRAYYATGSFVDWLIRSEGIEKFKRVYFGHSFISTYQQALPRLIKNWQLSLIPIQVSDQDIKKAQEYLVMKPFYQKHCVHEVADLLMKYNLCGKTECAPYLFQACDLDIENLKLQTKCEAVKNKMIN